MKHTSLENIVIFLWFSLSLSRKARTITALFAVGITKTIGIISLTIVIRRIFERASSIMISTIWPYWSRKESKIMKKTELWLALRRGSWILTEATIFSSKWTAAKKERTIIALIPSLLRDYSNREMTNAVRVRLPSQKNGTRQQQNQFTVRLIDAYFLISCQKWIKLWYDVHHLPS